MRIKAGEEGADTAVVTVDGEVAQYCVEACEEGGWVRELWKRPNGDFAHGADSMLIRMRAGAVRVTLGGR